MPPQIDRRELERLAKLATSLIVNCHHAERARKPSEWDEVLSAFDDVAVTLIRKKVLQGDLRAVAELLIRPQSRAECGLTFLAEVERYLEADDVRQLRELWKVPAEDKAGRLDRLVQQQGRAEEQ